MTRMLKRRMRTVKKRCSRVARCSSLVKPRPSLQPVVGLPLQLLQSLVSTFFDEGRQRCLVFRSNPDVAPVSKESLLVGIEDQGVEEGVISVGVAGEGLHLGE